MIITGLAHHTTFAWELRQTVSPVSLTAVLDAICLHLWRKPQNQIPRLIHPLQIGAHRDSYSVMCMCVMDSRTLSRGLWNKRTLWAMTIQYLRSFFLGSASKAKPLTAPLITKSRTICHTHTIAATMPPHYNRQSETII